MGHLSLVLIILAFGVGMAASAHAISLYNRFPLRYLRIHAALLIFLNIAVFLGLLFNYIQINLMNQSPFYPRNIFSFSYYLMLSVLTAFILYFFIGLVFTLLNKDRSKKFRILFWIYFSGLILCQIIYLLIGPGTQRIPYYAASLAGIAISFYLVGYILVFMLFFHSKQFKTLPLFFFLIFSSSLCLDAFQLFEVLILEEYLLFKSALFYTINLVSLFRLKAFVKSAFPQETSPAGMSVLMNYLFEKYKLTQREQQVIRLICSGKSSRDMENELFLSPHTIKEYIYRIYKKTGVKNRVQLVNLFRDR